MSDEDLRALEARAQDDALAAGRLAILERRAGNKPRLIPVSFDWSDDQRFRSQGTGWILEFCSTGNRSFWAVVVVDEVKRSHYEEQLGLDRGRILSVPLASLRVQPWFLP